MNIHIIGAGSLGLLYAGRLADSGCSVTVWCRSEEQTDKLRNSGITIESVDGQQLQVNSNRFTVNSWTSFAGSSSITDADYIFLMIKQQGIEQVAAEMLQPLAQNHHKLICFQNGTGHLEHLHELLPNWSLYAAITTEGARRTSDVSVLHAGHGTTTIGKMISDENSQQENAEIELVKGLNRAGFEAFLSKEMKEIIYRKLLINAVINPLTALWSITNGELLLSPERVDSMKRLYDEGIAVYEAGNIPYGSNLWEAIIQVCRSTSGNTSSMLKDVLENRTTEVAWINGSIARMGRQFGASVPTHELIEQLIRGMKI